MRNQISWAHGARSALSWFILRLSLSIPYHWFGFSQVPTDLLLLPSSSSIIDNSITQFFSPAQAARTHLFPRSTHSPASQQHSVMRPTLPSPFAERSVPSICRILLCITHSTLLNRSCRSYRSTISSAILASGSTLLLTSLPLLHALPTSLPFPRLLLLLLCLRSQLRSHQWLLKRL
jgi:hypothetical protein